MIYFPNLIILFPSLKVFSVTLLLIGELPKTYARAVCYRGLRMPRVMTKVRPGVLSVTRSLNFVSQCAIRVFIFHVWHEEKD